MLFLFSNELNSENVLGNTNAENYKHLENFENYENYEEMPEEIMADSYPYTPDNMGEESIY